MKLTTRRIETLECPAGKKDVLVFDDEQRGLGVRVTAAGEQDLSGAIHLGGVQATHPARLMLGDFAGGRARGRAERSSATWRRAATRPPTAKRRRWRPSGRPRMRR